MTKHLGILILSLSIASPKTFAGRYSQKCEQAGKSSQQSCQGATQTANAGDNAQAGAIGSTTGARATANPGAQGMMDQSSAQIGRLSAASGQCQQAKKDCEQKCDQQKQSANGDQKARQQGEPAQVDQSKQSQCSQAVDAQIAPLLAALAMAMAALMAAKKSEEQSNDGNVGIAQTNPIAETPKPETPKPEDKKGDATFLAQPQAIKTGTAAIQAAGGEVTSKGVKLPDGSFQSWSSLAGGGSGGGSTPGPSSGEASLDTGGAGAGALNRANVMAMATTEGDGGGSSDSAYGAGGGYDNNAGGRGPASANHRAASAAGMKVDYMGTPIGVKSDNIFTMIHRAYDRKREANVFLTEAAPPKPPPQAQKRIPAVGSPGTELEFAL